MLTQSKITGGTDDIAGKDSEPVFSVSFVHSVIQILSPMTFVIK